MRVGLLLLLASVGVLSQECDLDVLFVIDSTGSVSKDFDAERQYASTIVEGMSIGPGQQRVGVVLYSSYERKFVVIQIGEIEDKEVLLTRVRALPYYGGTTNTGAALELAQQELQANGKSSRTLVIVIHDGFSTDKSGPPADAIRATGATVVAVGVPEKLYKAELLAIAGGIEENVYIGSGSASELVSKHLQCGPAPPVPTTAAPPVVNPSIPSMTPDPTAGQTPAPNNGYEIPPTGKPIVSVSGCTLDVLFIMDASGSVEDTFKKELELARSIVNDLIVGPDNARVAMIKFAGRHKERIIFGFDEHQDQASVLDAIDKVTWIGGTTDIKSALQLALNVTSGVRTGIQPLVIMFTDGYSFSEVLPEADQLRANAAIYVIAIEDIAFDRMILERIAGDAARVFTDANMQEFQAEEKRLTSSCRSG